MSDSETGYDEWAEQDDVPVEHADWPLRPLLLALLGLATGLAVHCILGEWSFRLQPSAVQLAEVAALTVGAGLIGFTVERQLWWTSVLFGIVMGALAGGVVWWNGDIGHWSGGDGWRTVSLFLGIAIAAPLYQAARDAGMPRFRYPSVHDHAWTNVVLWCASWAFVGIAFLLAFLLAGLFDLIKIHFLKDLLQKEWFLRALTGLAFGGALGMLREHGAVVRLLQRVVATVLAVLAPVLAVGLVLFVLALPFTGLSALWDATSATTPLLLACVIGALILSNAVIGNAPDEERRFPVLRYAAMALGLVMLPLAAIAAVATGLRIGQYGFTPDRLWALTFVVIACAYGLAYWVSLVRGRREWAEQVRPANLNLAFALCIVALVLATPLISFNAISVQDQVARLESGKTALDTFDWRALAFDFGQPGRDALKKLQGSANATIKARADAAAKSDYRYQVPDAEQATQVATLDQRLRVLPAGTALPAGLRALVADDYPCGTGNAHCTLVLPGEGREAYLMQEGCFTAPRPAATPKAMSGSKEAVVEMVPEESGKYCGGVQPQRYVLVDGKWSDTTRRDTNDESDAARAARVAGFQQGQIEVRTVERRQVFVGGKPVGDAFQ